MLKTKISTFDSTWNPVSGCYHNCEYCYARGIAKRFSTEDKCHSFYDGKPIGKIHVLDNPARVIETGKISPYPFGFAPTLHRYRLNDYVGEKGRNIFVCSMADLFSDWVPDSWIEEVFAACEKAPQHNYLFLTKNPGRYIELAHVGKLPKRENMWYGSTLTNPSMDAFWAEEYNTFWSIEPILQEFGKMDEGERRLPDWFIIGAETGHKKDKVVPDRKWIEDIVNECRENGKPVFMKSSLEPIWGEPLIQEFPEGLKKEEKHD